MMGGIARNCSHSNPEVRKSALVSVSRLDGFTLAGERDIQLHMVRLLNEDSDAAVRSMASRTLKNLRIHTLKAMLEHDSHEVMVAAVAVLAEHDASELEQAQLDPTAFSTEVAHAVRLCTADNATEQMRVAAIGVLAKLPPPALAVHALPVLAHLLEAKGSKVRKSTVEALGKLAPAELLSRWLSRSLPLLAMLEHDEDAFVRREVCKTISKTMSSITMPMPTAAEDVVISLLSAISDEDKACRAQVVQAVSRLNATAISLHAEKLAAHLADARRDVRLAALEVCPNRGAQTRSHLAASLGITTKLGLSRVLA